MSHTSRTSAAPSLAQFHQREGFDDALYRWMQRAPWLALSALAHALLFAMLLAIPWELLTDQDPAQVDVVVAHIPEDPFEEPVVEPAGPEESAAAHTMH